MRRWLAVALVGLCLASAGCSGLFSADQATAETVTPAPVPTADPTTGPEQRAPGIVGERVVDPTALGRAHVRGLSNTSYEVHYSRTVMSDGDLHKRTQIRATIAANYQSYAASRTITGRNVTDRRIDTAWRDGRALQRTTVNGSTTTEVVADSRGIGGPPRPPRAALFFQPTFNDRLITLFSASNITSIRPADSVIKQLYGASLYRVKGYGATEGTAIATRPADRVTNVSFSATVTPNGVVRSYALQYSVHHRNETYRVMEVLRYSDLGTTEVTFTEQRRQSTAPVNSEDRNRTG